MSSRGMASSSPSSIEPAGVRSVAGIIIPIKNRQGIATLFINRIVVMNGGKVEQIGAPLELYDRPANVFVTGFIGSPAMNMIGGQITEAGFKAADLTLPLPQGVATRGLATYDIRPEHLALADEGVPATVALVEPMGSETQVTLALGDHRIIGVFRERLTARPGETIRVRPDLGAIHLFDEAGMRVN